MEPRLNRTRNVAIAVTFTSFSFSCPLAGAALKVKALRTALSVFHYLFLTFLLNIKLRFKLFSFCHFFCSLTCFSVTDVRQTVYFYLVVMDGWMDFMAYSPITSKFENETYVSVMSVWPRI